MTCLGLCRISLGKRIIWLSRTSTKHLITSPKKGFRQDDFLNLPFKVYGLSPVKGINNEFSEKLIAQPLSFIPEKHS
jgi:hypothetical protein